MNSKKAEKLFKQDREHRRRAYFHCVSATRRQEALSRRSGVDATVIADARLEIDRAAVKYLEAVIRVRESRKILNAAIAFAGKMEIAVGIILCGLICAVLFPLVGAVSIPGGMFAHIIVGGVFGASMRYLFASAPAVATTIGGKHYPNLMFSLVLLWVFALPVMEVWWLSLTGILSILSLLKLVIGCAVSVASFVFVPSQVSKRL
jgi:hypothetical protein